jgi:hypothetical protein
MCFVLWLQIAQQIILQSSNLRPDYNNFENMFQSSGCFSLTYYLVSYSGSEYLAAFKLIDGFDLFGKYNTISF